MIDVHFTDARDLQAQNRQAVAGIEMALAAPFVAIGAAMIAMAAVPATATAKTTAMVANAGGHSIRFKPFISAAKQGLAGGALGAGAAIPAFAQSDTASSHSALSAEDQEILARWTEWNQRQLHQQSTLQNYLFWEDLPETSHD